MKFLFPKNYRNKDYEIIINNLKTRNKLWISYLYDTGKNPFVRFLDFKIPEFFPEALVFTLDENILKTENTDLFSKLYTFLSTRLQLGNKEIKSDWIMLENLLKLYFNRKNRFLVLNIQFDYINSEDKFQNNLLTEINELRKFNPLQIIPVIHSFWDHKLEKLNNHELMKGSKLVYSAFNKENFSEALYYFEKKNLILSNAEKFVFWQISGGIPLIYKQAFLFSLDSAIEITGRDFVEKFRKSNRFLAYAKQLSNDLGTDYLQLVVNIAQEKRISKDELAKLILLKELGLINLKNEISSLLLNSYFNKLPQIKKSIKIDLLEVLTKIEFQIYKYLKSKQGVVTREELAQEIWGENYLHHYSDYALDKHISNLRSKLMQNELGEIKSIKGVGFVFKPILK